MSVYDAVVLGLGGMGSAAAAHLAKRGQRVLGLEQFPLGHERGASAGSTRIIRKAYFEGPGYVPLLERAYTLWRELEAATGTTLLDLTGMLLVGMPDGAAIAGVARCVDHHGITIEQWDAAQIGRRFPQMRLLPGEVGLYEPDAGIVFPEAAIAAHQHAARAAGAELRGNAVVSGWRRTATGCLRLDVAGERPVQAERLIVCAGPWLADVLHDLNLPLTVQRNVQIWFAPPTPGFERGRLPTFFLERAGLPRPLYGFPDLGAGVKAALHGFGATTAADALDRTIHVADIAAVAAALAGFLPGAAGTYASGKACMYTLTPDEHFIIDHHPHDDGIIIAGGFSGHGYKFCSVVGEIIADLAGGVPRPDIAFLRLQRFNSDAIPA